MADEMKSCVVCGQGSTRKDWIQKQGSLVACDNHTKEEFQKAVATATSAGTPKTVSTSTPQQPSSGPTLVKEAGAPTVNVPSVPGSSFPSGGKTPAPPSDTPPGVKI